MSSGLIKFEVLWVTMWLQTFRINMLLSCSGFRSSSDRVWRKLHNEELRDLYSLPNIVRVVKSRRMRWAGHVARVGEGRVCTGFWWGNLRERDHLGDPDVDGRVILRWIFRKREAVVGSGWSWLRIGTGGGRLWVR